MTTQNDRCLICGAPCKTAIDLPGLPLTDSYGMFGCKPAKAPQSEIDQQLLICSKCGHGQLANIVSPEALYTSEYSFRTSTSQTASAGTDFFISFLANVAANRRFKCAIDVGCNDLHLLCRLSGVARHRIGIDPIWAGRESENTDPGITVSGAMFEDVDLKTLLPEPADLVVSRHTMEHIHQPVEMIGILMAHAAPDALFVIEVPGFDTLVARHRYDQVFHQHVHYYSKNSLRMLLRETGCEEVAMAENYHNWGAILLAFRRTAAPKPTNGDIDALFRQVVNGYSRFRRDLADVDTFISSLGGPIYGYGAAQMLPVLGYHMNTDFSFLRVILDDDPGKDGWGYWNLPVKIQKPRPDTVLSDATVLVTAVDNTAPILRRLLQNRPRHIVTPFRLI